MILGSSSQFFRNILLNIPHQNPFIYLKGIRHKELESLIQFIYLGQCEVGHEDLELFLTLSEDLEVQILREIVKQDEDIVNNEVNADKEIEQQYDKNNISCDIESKKFTYDCDMCNSSLSFPRNLIRHKQSVHEGLFECEQCGSSYTDLGNLKNTGKLCMME